MPEFNKQRRWQAPLGVAPGGMPGYLITDDSIIIGAGSSVVSVDRFTGAQRYRHMLTKPVTVDPRYIGTFGGQLLVADDHSDSTLYVLNPKTGQFQQFMTLQGTVNWLLGIGKQLYASSDKNLYLIGLAQRRWQILKQGGAGSIAPPLYSEGLLYCTTNNNVVAFALDAFASRWQATVNGAVVSAPTLDDQTLYVGTGDQRTVYAFDSQTGSLLWQSSRLPARIVQNIAAGKDCVYAPGENAIVYALDKNQGQLLDQIPQTGAATSPILVNPVDNILYTTTQSDVIAYAPDTRNELTYNVGSWPYLIGTNASDIYVGGGQQIESVNFTEVLKQFSIDSTLIQDFETDGAPISQGKGLSPVPYYNTEIFLHNPDKTPLINTTVKIRSTTTTTVKIGGQSYSLNPTQPVEVATDGNGRLRVESRAEGISTPPLLLWAPFLAAHEEIAIYPDHSVHSNLAATSGDDLFDAKDYNGDYILTNPYRQDTTARNNAAQAIRNALGMTIRARTGKSPQPPSPDRKRGIPVNTLPINAGAFFITNSSALNPAMTLPNNWHLNLQSGQDAFRTDITRRDIEQWDTANRNEFAKRSLSGDLWEAIKNGAKLVETFVYQAGDTILTNVKAFVNGAWQFFKEVVLDTVEKAVQLVQGILHEIVEKAKSAVEWLSFVFNWDAILENHNKFSEKILSTLDTLAHGPLLDNMKPVISGVFGDLKLKVNGLFDNLRAGIGQESFNSHRTDDDQGLMNAKSTWLVHKTTQNLDLDASGRKRSAGDPGPKLDVSIGQGVITALNNFLNNIKDDISADLHKTLEQLVNGFSKMSASDIFAGSIAAILTLFEGVADMVIDVTKNLVLAIVDLLKAVLQSGLLKSLLTTEIPIPFVKDLYRYLTGQPMTLLNMATLLIAIPVTIAQRARLASSSGNRKREWDNWEMVNFVWPFWGLMDAGIEWKGGSEIGGAGEGMALLKSKLPWSQRECSLSALNGLGIGIPLAIQLLLIPDTVLDSISDPSLVAPTVLLWVLPFCAIMTDLFVAIITKGAEIARFVIAGQVILLLWGVAILLCVILFAVYNENFRKKPKTIAANAMLNMPLLFKLIRNVGGGVGVYVVAGIDFAGNLVGGILSIVVALEGG